MAHLLDTGTIVVALVDGFRPLVCTVNVYDNRKQLRYLVLDPADGFAVVSVFGIHISNLVEPEKLDAEIAQTRGRLERAGFVLDIHRSLRAAASSYSGS